MTSGEKPCQGEKSPQAPPYSAPSVVRGPRHSIQSVPSRYAAYVTKVFEILGIHPEFIDWGLPCYTGGRGPGTVDVGTGLKPCPNTGGGRPEGLSLHTVPHLQAEEAGATMAMKLRALTRALPKARLAACLLAIVLAVFLAYRPVQIGRAHV